KPLQLLVGRTPCSCGIRKRLPQIGVCKLQEFVIVEALLHSLLNPQAQAFFEPAGAPDRSATLLRVPKRRISCQSLSTRSPRSADRTSHRLPGRIASGTPRLVFFGQDPPPAAYASRAGKENLRMPVFCERSYSLAG